jgi:hypothetical protein
MQGAALSTFATEIVVTAGCLIALGRLRARLPVPRHTRVGSRGVA